VTDAHVVLGHLDDRSPLAGDLTLDATAAARAVANLASALGMEMEKCATGIVSVAAAEMAQAVRVVTVERGTDPRDLALVLDPVFEGRADLALGARRPQRGAWPVHARLANAVLAAELRRRTGEKLRDLGPMRAARRDALLGLGITDRRFGWPLEMVLRASRAGWRLHETEVPYRPRSGRSKVTGTVRGTARTMRDMAGALR